MSEPSKPGSASSTSVKLVLEEVKASFSGITRVLLAAAHHCPRREPSYISTQCSRKKTSRTPLPPGRTNPNQDQPHLPRSNLCWKRSKLHFQGLCVCCWQLPITAPNTKIRRGPRKRRRCRPALGHACLQECQSTTAHSPSDNSRDQLSAAPSSTAVSRTRSSRTITELDIA